MPLISCPECKGKVSDKAQSCPHCGFPTENLHVTSSQLFAQAAKEHSSSQQCPSCQLITPDTQLNCDCGYNFLSGVVYPKHTLRADEISPSESSTKPQLEVNEKSYFRGQTRLILGLGLYCLVAIILGVSVPSNRQEATIGIFMLLTLIACSISGTWESWKRIGLPFVAWIGHGFVSLPIAVMWVYLVGTGHPATNIVVSVLASLPFIILGMRQSTIFLKKEKRIYD